MVWPDPHSPDRCLMAVYKAFYDASGTENTPGHLVVMGVVATEEAWPRFEEAWQAILSRFAITRHRHAEYVQNDCEFAKWTGNHPDRTAYLAALIDTHAACIENTFLVGIADASIKAVVERYAGFADDDGRGAYGFAGHLCRRTVEDWIHHSKPGSSIHHVFEDGDPGQAMLRLLMQVGPGGYDGFSVLPKCNSLGQWVRQFEAADMVAWEARRILDDRISPTSRPLRGAAKAIADKIPIVTRVPTTEVLLDICARGTEYFRPK
jgi:hypothetical protein